MSDYVGRMHEEQRPAAAALLDALGMQSMAQDLRTWWPRPPFVAYIAVAGDTENVVALLVGRCDEPVSTPPYPTDSAAFVHEIHVAEAARRHGWVTSRPVV
jgi:hypothetical protein